jgi:hypothetical protein
MSDLYGPGPLFGRRRPALLRARSPNNEQP